jgi:hypothetical protein
MKLMASFLAGVLVTGVTMGMISAPVLRAAEPETDEASFALSDLLPDIGRIYREALTSPFKEAEAQIYDDDIAAYYRKLMDNTGLTEMIAESEAENKD